MRISDWSSDVCSSDLNALMPEDAGLQPDLGRGLQAETATWLGLLAQEAQARLLRNEPAVMATLTRDFERILLETALDYSRGRRMEAAQRLGIGRNTLTPKCAELGLNETENGYQIGRAWGRARGRKNW